MFQRLLVAIDDSASTPLTLSYATALARSEGATVEVLHVNQYLVGGRGLTVLTATEATQLVDNAVGQLRDDGVEARGSTVRATCFNVGRAVAAAASSHDCDVILVGSRRRRGLQRPWGKSMRERIISLTPLPVLAAPAPLKIPAELRSQLPPPATAAAPLARH